MGSPVGSCSGVGVPDRGVTDTRECCECCGADRIMLVEYRFVKAHFGGAFWGAFSCFGMHRALPSPPF